MNGFTKEDEVVILELARTALADVDTYCIFAEALDLSDEYLFGLQARIESVTNGLPEEEDE